MNPQPPAPEFTEPQIRTGLRINIVAASFGMVWFGITQGLPLIMMMTALGASGVMIGMISMLNQLAMLIQIPASLLADRLTYRKPFWFTTCMIARVIWLIPALLMLFWKGESHTIIHGTLIVVGVSALLIQSSAASWWSWMADLIPDPMRSRFWNIRQGTCTSAMLITFGIAGWYLDRFPAGVYTGFGIVLLVGSIFGTLDILIHGRVPEPASTPGRPGVPLLERLVRPLRDRNFRTFTLVMCIWFFGLGLIGPFTMVYLKQQFHALYRQLSWIQMAGLLGSIGTSFYAGKLIGRAGIRTFGIIMMLMAPLFSTVWFFINPSMMHISLPFDLSISCPHFVALMVCSSLLGGSVYAAVGIYQLNMLTSIVPREGRTTSMAVHWFLIGLASATAPVLAGWIKDQLALHPVALTLPYGTGFAYMHVLLILHAALIWLIALPLTRKLTAVETDMSVVKALSHIFITNPLRMARDIYGFNGVIIASVEKTKDIVIQSAEFAKDAVQKFLRNNKDDSENHPAK
ncbi:MAG: MFS transporter [Kiritimatiellales bacterium]